MGTLEHAAALARAEDLQRAAARARLAAEAAPGASSPRPARVLPGVLGRLRAGRAALQE